MKFEINLKFEGEPIIRDKILSLFKENLEKKEDFIINIARFLMLTFKIKVEDNLTIESCKVIFPSEENNENAETT